jgi:hypothetical protein
VSVEGRSGGPSVNREEGGMSVFDRNPDPDAVEAPEPYTDEQAADSEGGRATESDVFVGESGWTYSYDPREGYDLGDPKRDGPGGYW